METTPKIPAKVKMTINLEAEAVDVLRFAGYCSDRTIGAFLSKLILDYHRQRRVDPTRADVAGMLRELADKLDM